MTAHRKYIFIGGGLFLAIVILASIYFTRSSVKSSKHFEVKKGRFEAVLTCKGEINGLVATVIRAPKILGDRDLRLWQMKILDLTQDGKNVKKGDFIIQLDASQVVSGMREEQQELEREMADLNNAKIDSAVRLTQMREDIKMQCSIWNTIKSTSNNRFTNRKHTRGKLKWPIKKRRTASKKNIAIIYLNRTE
jgi:HlyD family secretion protein